MKLYRYQKQLAKDSLKDVIIKGNIPEIEEIGYQANLEDVTDYASEIIGLQNSGGLKGTPEMDAKLAPRVYEALKHLNRRTLTDPFMWHWLTTTLFKDYVIARWWDHKGEFDSWLETGGATEHFLGSNSNAGFARNAVARVFWTAEMTLVGSSYDLTEKILSVPDLHAGIFERDLGLEPRLAKICIDKMHHLKESHRRAAVRYLRIQMTAIPFEAINNSKLEHFVNDVIKKTG